MHVRIPRSLMQRRYPPGVASAVARRPAPTVTPDVGAQDLARGGIISIPPLHPNVVAVLSSSVPGSTGRLSQLPHRSDRASLQAPGVANLIPPKSCQRHPRGTANAGPGASTTDAGDRVSVAST